MAANDNFFQFYPERLTVGDIQALERMFEGLDVIFVDMLRVNTMMRRALIRYTDATEKRLDSVEIRQPD